MSSSPKTPPRAVQWVASLLSPQPNRGAVQISPFQNISCSAILSVTALVLIFLSFQFAIFAKYDEVSSQHVLQIAESARVSLQNQVLQPALKKKPRFLLKDALEMVPEQQVEIVEVDEEEGDALEPITTTTTWKPLVKVADPMPPSPVYDKKDLPILEWQYLKDEKLPPYVGSQKWMSQFNKTTHRRQWLNSQAVFPYDNENKQHGLLGVYPNGTRLWQPLEIKPDINKHIGGTDGALKDGGGFYLEMSNYLSLDRVAVDGRESVCLAEKYDYQNLDDASIVITFYNEPLSTLLRSVHSVLNKTPPCLIREIILVDDHSNSTDNLPGGPLYEYVKLLPKTKILRLPERRGLVMARLAGAQAAKAPVLVVLDSHIEVNNGWLEPQLKRLKESPTSVVFPQILAINAETFEYEQHAGIGCWLTWYWQIVEKASMEGKLGTSAAIPSASMAGGLFAVNLDWFWKVGGYDEEFAMWGAENVEMPFRVWMCGGRVECVPCARTYHIYRKGGVGYSSPSNAIQKNRLRTARVWMDEWYQVAEKFILGGREHSNIEDDYGNIDSMLELKERLKCKGFGWFLENVDPNHDLRNFQDDIELIGELRNHGMPNHCLDTMSGGDSATMGVYPCHRMGGSQGYFKSKQKKQIELLSNERNCMAGSNHKNITQEGCHDTRLTDGWSKHIHTDIAVLDNKGPSKQVVSLRWTEGKSEFCLDVQNDNLLLRECDVVKYPNQLWRAELFKSDPHFSLPTFSDKYKLLHPNARANTI